MTTPIDAKIRLGAQFDNALKALRDLRREVVNVKQEGTKPSGQPFPGLRDGAADLTAQLRAARQQLLAFVGIQIGVEGARNLADMADGFAGLSARLRVATRDQNEYRQALSTTRQLSVQYQAPLAETATLYTRVLRAVQPLGGGLREADVATRSLLASLKLNGASTAEYSSAILQLSQALGAGVLRGEEFNAINEAAPPLLDALAKGLGKPRSELKLLAEQGELTTAKVLSALSKTLPELEREAAQMPRTIGGAVQEVGNSITEFVGKTAEGSNGVTALVNALRLLAQNIEPLVNLLGLLAAGMVALKVGALAGQFVTWAAGIGTVTAVLPALLAGLRALLALVGGPVGLVVALASLAVGWNLVADAKRKSGEATAESLQKEREAVLREIEELRRTTVEKGGFVAPEVLREMQLAEARLRRINAQIDEQRRAGVEDLRRSELAGTGGTNERGVQLRDPAAIRQFEDDYKTRATVVRKFEQERRSYTLAIDAEIAAARKAGDAQLEAELTQRRTDTLAEQSKAEKDALRKFGADVTVTRVAQYREQYDRLLAVVSDGTERQLQENQALHDQQLRSAAEYFRQRTELEEQQAGETIARIQSEIEARRKVMDLNRQRLGGAKDANEAQGFKDAIDAERATIDQLEVSLIKAERDRADAARRRQADESRTTAELQAQTAEIERQVREANDQLTLADIRLRVQAQFAELRRREQAETGGTVNTDALIEAQTRIAQLQQLQRDYATVVETVRLKEQEIDAEVTRGALTSVEAEEMKFAARAKSIPQLQAILQLIQQSAQTDAERNAAKALLLDLQALGEKTTELQKALRSSAQSELSQMLTDVATRAETAGDALENMLVRFGKRMLQLLNDRLAEKMLNQFMDAIDDMNKSSSNSSSGSGGNNSGWMAALASWIATLFHSGGVVGQGGGGLRRSVHPGVFAYAPRYHTGGIVGLRRNEVPAILEEGEEVLTEDDPRHSRNRGGAGIGNVSIAVNVEGASGTEGDQRAAAQALAGMVEQKVNEWALRESRNGGILSRR